MSPILKSIINLFNICSICLSSLEWLNYESMYSFSFSYSSGFPYLGDTTFWELFLLDKFTSSDSFDNILLDNSL